MGSNDGDYVGEAEEGEAHQLIFAAVFDGGIGIGDHLLFSICIHETLFDI